MLERNVASQPRPGRTTLLALGRMFVVIIAALLVTRLAGPVVDWLVNLTGASVTIGCSATPHLGDISALRWAAGY